MFCEALDGKLAGVNVFFQLLGQGFVKQHGKSIAYSAATRDALCENGRELSVFRHDERLRLLDPPLDRLCIESWHVATGDQDPGS